MEPSSSHKSPQAECSKCSLALSEEDDMWLKSLADSCKTQDTDAARQFDTYDRKFKSDLSNAPTTPNKAETTVAKNNTEEQTEGSTKELVTTNIHGKNYVLPFTHLPECKEDQSTKKKINKQRGQHPAEGLYWHDPAHQVQIINLLFRHEPVQQERVLQKKNLCGDFTFPSSDKMKCHSKIQTLHKETKHGDLLGTDSNIVVCSAKELRVDRTPFLCPISNCDDFVSAGFYSSHLKIEHCGLILEKLIPGQSRSILVNPKLNVHGKNHCNIVYYLANKVHGFGHSEFRNIIPVLLMSSKFQYVDLEPGKHSRRSSQATRTHFMYWFTGIVSESLKIQYSLRISPWQQHHGWIYPLSESQDLKNVFQSGAGLIFSQNWVDQLVTRKDKLLEMRLSLR